MKKMKKTSFILLFFTLFTIPLFSQKNELGKVTLEELSQKNHPIDSSAVAAILFKIGEVRFEFSPEEGFEMVTVVKMKIKIYKKEGYEWANHSMKVYVGGNTKETVSYKNAITYNLVDGKIEKTKLKSEGEFVEKVNKYWDRKKITMPNVKEGSIVEYEYITRSKQIGAIDRWDFQTSIPINFCEYKTYIPEFYEYNVSQKGYIFPKVESEKVLKTNTFTSKERNQTSTRVSTDFSQEKFEYQELKTVFKLQNVPALKDESYVNNINNYTSSVEFELSVIRYPNEPVKSLSTTWEAVTKTIYDDPDFGLELNKTGYFEDDLNLLLKDVNDQHEKIAIIFNFVKAKVKWNEFNSYQCDGGVKRAYKDMIGNSAEINLMLTAMLRFAGVEANPVLVSTRSNGINVFPNRTAFNYVIAAVENQNELILLDATDKNALPNILPIRDLNWMGRIIRKNGSSAEVDLMSKTVSNNVTNMMVTLSKDGVFEGKIRQQHFDYNAYFFRNRYGELSKDAYLEYLEKRNNNCEVIEYEVSGKSDLSQPIVENYSIKSSNLVETIGDKMYFSPLLFFVMSENPFKQDVREYPIDFIFPTQDRFMINITLPDGYSIESMPTSISVPMSDDLINAKFLLSGEGNRIQVSYIKEIKASIISPEYYDELKAVFNELVKKENEKIVIKKI